MMMVWIHFGKDESMPITNDALVCLKAVASWLPLHLIILRVAVVVLGHAKINRTHTFREWGSRALLPWMIHHDDDDDYWIIASFIHDH